MENKRVVHHLQAASITIGNQRGGGRHPTFTPEQKAEFQGKLEEALLSLQVKRKPNLAIAYVRTIIGAYRPQTTPSSNTLFVRFSES
jgi:hypothetical protein